MGLSLSYVRREIVRWTRSQRVQSHWAMCALQTRDPRIWSSPALDAHASLICGRDEVRAVSRRERRRNHSVGHFVV
jgi:hypothetical protein